MGPDICGFLGDTNAELCKRWSALGAFYPFSRNHNGDHNIDQDPAVWVDRGHPEVTKAALNSLRLRYQLLPYLYTLFYHAHNHGITIARPVFHEFPMDSNTFTIDEQFMLGTSVLISPFLYEKQTVVNAYLPYCVWYEVISNLKNVNKVKKINTGHVTLTDNDAGVPPIHIRGGTILAMSSQSEHANTDSVRQKPFDILVLPGEDGSASGDLFWDDGDSIDTIEKEQYNYFTFGLHSNCSLDLNVIKSGYSTKLVISNVVIYGTNTDSVVVTLDGKTVSSIVTNSIRIQVNLDLSSKKSGQKWTLNWKSSKTNNCNLD